MLLRWMALAVMITACTDDPGFDATGEWSMEATSEVVAGQCPPVDHVTFVVDEQGLPMAMVPEIATGTVAIGDDNALATLAIRNDDLTIDGSTVSVVTVVARACGADRAIVGSGVLEISGSLTCRRAFRLVGAIR